MDVVRGRSETSKVTRRTDTFTGDVWGEALLTTDDGVAMSTVYFAPGARTHWHRHEIGQALHVTSGEGLVTTRDGQVARVRAGDTVWAPGGEEHWHGAGPDTFLVHNTTSVGQPTWLGEVTAEEYEHSHRHEH
jgi:quercetin dioxygenase-like cupin family protein